MSEPIYNISTPIHHDLDRKCLYHSISFYQWLCEIISVSIFIIFSLIYSLKRITLPKKIKHPNEERTGKNILLLLMATLFGYEIAYKFSSNTIIHILSPCYISTIIQLYILVVKPSRLVTALFRLQLNFLAGPITTFLFPQVDSRIIFAHKSVYFLHHGMMFIIPIYLIRIGGVYSVGPLHDFSWNILATVLNIGYHYWFILPLAFPTQINLNYMLCPATADPFNYEVHRIAAIVHQGIFGALLGKLISLVCDFYFTQYPSTKSRVQQNSLAT